MLAHQNETSDTQRATPVAQLAAQFTRDELERLAALRTRYEQGGDRFSERELATLCFLRWLRVTGRVAS